MKKGQVAIIVVAVIAVGLMALLASMRGGSSVGGSSAQTPAMVTIGAIYPVYGANAAVVKDILAGEQFAVDYVNNHRDYPGASLPLETGAGLPHLRGARLKLVVAKLSSDPSDRCNAQPMFDRLVTQGHVAAVLGAFESTLTLRAIAAASALRVPLVNESSTAASLTQPDQRSGRQDGCGHPSPPTPSPWFFRVGPSDMKAAEEFAALIDEARHSGIRVRKVAILHENDDIFGDNAASVTSAVLVEHGILRRDIRTFRYRTGLSQGAPLLYCTKDEKARALVAALGSRVQAIRRYQPDVVFAVAYPPDAIVTVQTMQKLRYTPRVAFFAYGTASAGTAFIPAVGRENPSCGLPSADPTGIITRAAWAPASYLLHASQTATAIEDAFKQRYHRDMGLDSAGGFTAALTLAKAIDNAGSTDHDRIRQALVALEVPADQTIMPWAGIAFDRNGQNIKAAVVLQQIRRNRPSGAVYPLAVATTGPIFPLDQARR